MFDDRRGVSHVERPVLEWQVEAVSPHELEARILALQKTRIVHSDSCDAVLAWIPCLQEISGGMPGLDGDADIHDGAIVMVDAQLQEPLDDESTLANEDALENTERRQHVIRADVLGPHIILAWTCRLAAGRNGFQGHASASGTSITTSSGVPHTPSFPTLRR